MPVKVYEGKQHLATEDTSETPYSLFRFLEMSYLWKHVRKRVVAIVQWGRLSLALVDGYDLSMS